MSSTDNLTGLLHADQSAYGAIAAEETATQIQEVDNAPAAPGRNTPTDPPAENTIFGNICECMTDCWRGIFGGQVESLSVAPDDAGPLTPGGQIVENLTDPTPVRRLGENEEQRTTAEPEFPEVDPDFFWGYGEEPDEGLTAFSSEQGAQLSEPLAPQPLLSRKGGFINLAGLAHSHLRVERTVTSVVAPGKSGGESVVVPEWINANYFSRFAGKTGKEALAQAQKTISDNFGLTQRTIERYRQDTNTNLVEVFSGLSENLPKGVTLLDVFYSAYQNQTIDQDEFNEFLVGYSICEEFGRSDECTYVSRTRKHGQKEINIGTMSGLVERAIVVTDNNELTEMGDAYLNYIIDNLVRLNCQVGLDERIDLGQQDEQTAILRKQAVKSQLIAFLKDNPKANFLYSISFDREKSYPSFKDYWSGLMESHNITPLTLVSNDGKRDEPFSFQLCSYALLMKLCDLVRSYERKLCMRV